MTNPTIFSWARETAGLSIEAAAHKLGVRVERLTDIENGKLAATRPLLSKMAKAYRRSLLVFYLPNPPKTGDVGRDFRMGPGQASPEFDADLNAIVREITVRQSIVKSLLEDLEAEEVSFIHSEPERPSVESMATRLIAVTNFSLQDFRAEPTPERAFAYLRSKIEAAGVFVLLVGDLGSHHTAVPPETFRGFAVSDAIAPFIVVNDQDAHSAWSFTALHELVHVCLGETGVSGGVLNNQTEQYCNDVAGEILLPSADLRELAGVGLLATNELAVRLTSFAQVRNVSSSMVAYRSFRNGLLTHQAWNQLSKVFRDQWVASRIKTPGQKSGGPNYYTVRRHRIGFGLADLMRRSLDEGLITYSKAGRVLGVKPTNVDALLRIGANP